MENGKGKKIDKCLPFASDPIVNLLKFYLFIYFWLHWVFLLYVGFLQLQRMEATLITVPVFLMQWQPLVVEQRLQVMWALVGVVLGLSSCGSWVLEHRLRSCGSWAYLPCGTWNLPRSGIKPDSPTLAGEFLTARPPGQPQL